MVIAANYIRKKLPKKSRRQTQTNRTLKNELTMLFPEPRQVTSERHTENRAGDQLKRTELKKMN